MKVVKEGSIEGAECPGVTEWWTWCQWQVIEFDNTWQHHMSAIRTWCISILHSRIESLYIILIRMARRRMHDCLP